ncbi:MAG: hypothetical protein AABZ77_02960 [Chloroflexota bacterium]
MVMRQQPGEMPFDMAENASEVYADSVQVGTNLYGSTLYLGKLREGQKPLTLSVVKVSPQMLKALGLIINKHVREYERDIGPIALPKQLLHDIGLEELL